MSWSIGEVTLPVPPKKASVSLPNKLEVVPTTITLPFVFDYGLLTRKLKLEGKIVEAGKTAAQLETDYLNKLLAMVQKPSAFARVIGDDDYVAGGLWTPIGWGSAYIGVPTISDETIIVKKGKNSVKLVGTSDSFRYGGIQRIFSSAIDISKQDFITYWFYRETSGTQTTGIELYDGTVAETNEVVDTVVANTWTRYLRRLDSWTSVNKKNITRIRIGSFALGTWWFDKICFGVGYLLTAPDTRYDGVYALKKFEFTEEKRVVNSFGYEMELWDFNDFY